MSSKRLEQIGYVIVLCDDLERMKAFYRDLLALPVENEDEELSISPIMRGMFDNLAAQLVAWQKRIRVWET